MASPVTWGHGPKMLLRAMSLYVAAGLTVPLENTGMSLVWTAAGDHMDVQELCRMGPAPHWLQHSGEMAQEQALCLAWSWP